MGRANRMLAPRVRAIATGFAGILDRDPALAAKATHTGNPVRPAVIAAAATPYPPLDAGGPLQLLVFGGSQGARVMADIVPAGDRAARAALADAAEDRAAGARGGSAARARDLCEAAGRRPRWRRSSPTCRRAWRRAIWWCRAPAPRPSPSLRRSAGPRILVPLPHALDQDQRANAGVLMEAGGAIRLDQAEFTPERLAAEIAALAAEPGAACRHGRGRQGGRLDRRRRPARRSGAAGGGSPVDPSGGHVRHSPSAFGQLKPVCRPIRQPRNDAAMKLPREIGPIHFVGIGGIGMSGIAEVLMNLGYTVQGSDATDNANVKRLRDKGAKVFDRPQGREPRRRRGAGGVVGDQARQPGTRRRARASGCRWCAAPRCWPS